MCEPASIIAGVTAVIGVTVAVVDAVSTEDTKNKAEKAAKDAARQGAQMLSLRQMQEQQAASQSIFFADLDARQAEAQARVAAGESGVAGTSVDVILDDIERQRLMASVGLENNANDITEQLSREKEGVRSQAANRIAATPGANPWATGIRIAGAGADAASIYYKNKPSAGPKG